MMRKALLSAMVAAGAIAAMPSAHAQGANRLLGEILIVTSPRCPMYTAEANGQSLYISQNTMLFSLYGTNFGGDGTTTFNLPDLRGRSATGVGSGEFGNNQVGDYGGSDSVTLTPEQLGPHGHPADLMASDQAGNVGDPANASLATLDAARTYDNNGTALPLPMAPDSIGVQPTGGGPAIPLRGPYLGLRYCVVTTGVLPQRP